MQETPADSRVGGPFKEVLVNTIARETKNKRKQNEPVLDAATEYRALRYGFRPTTCAAVLFAWRWNGLDNCRSGRDVAMGTIPGRPCLGSTPKTGFR